MSPREGLSSRSKPRRARALSEEFAEGFAEGFAEVPSVKFSRYELVNELLYESLVVEREDVERDEVEEEKEMYEAEEGRVGLRGCGAGRGATPKESVISMGMWW